MDSVTTELTEEASSVYEKLSYNAAYTGDIKSIRELSNNGIIIPNSGLNGAAAAGNIELAEMFIDLNADDFDTALVYAMDNKREEMIEFLLESNGTDYSYAYARSVFYKMKDLAERLKYCPIKDYGPVLSSAVMTSNEELFDELLNENIKTVEDISEELLIDSINIAKDLKNEYMIDKLLEIQKQLFI